MISYSATFQMYSLNFLGIPDVYHDRIPDHDVRCTVTLTRKFKFAALGGPGGPGPARGDGRPGGGPGGGGRCAVVQFKFLVRRRVTVTAALAWPSRVALAVRARRRSGPPSAGALVRVHPPSRRRRSRFIAGVALAVYPPFKFLLKSATSWGCAHYLLPRAANLPVSAARQENHARRR